MGQGGDKGSVESLGSGVNWADWCWEGGLRKDRGTVWGGRVRGTGLGSRSPWFWGHGDTGDSGDTALLSALLCPHPDMWHPGFFLEESQELPVAPPPESCALTVKDLLLSGSSDNVSPCPCVPNTTCPQPCPFLGPDHPHTCSFSLPAPCLSSLSPPGPKHLHQGPIQAPWGR